MKVCYTLYRINQEAREARAPGPTPRRGPVHYLPAPEKRVKKEKKKTENKQVEQSSAIRCELRRFGSINDSLTVHFTSNSNAQNVSE